MAQKTSVLEALSVLDEDVMAALIHNDFASFMTAMFPVVNQGCELEWAAYLGPICSRLQDVAHGDLQGLIITVPPRHLKSFLVSAALPAFVLGHYPNQHVMNISYGMELAKDLASQTLAIMRSAIYREMFGEVLMEGRQPLHLIKTKMGGRRRATSIDGAATGMGAHLIIFDDPQKPGETLSEAIRRATNTAYERTFRTRTKDPKNTRIVIVMQRLHEDDFVGHVLGLGGSWEVMNFPAIAEEDEEILYQTVLGTKIYRRRVGQALSPGHHPLHVLEALRAEVGEALWAAQFQGHPTPAGGGLVQAKWLRPYDPADLPEKFDRVVQSWDTANKSSEWNDWSVCTTWGLKGKHIYLLHVFRKRLIYPDLRKAVLEQANIHDADVVFIEDQASGTQILQELRAEGFGKLRPVKPSRDKETRMVNQTGLIENGYVHVPREAEWLAEYVHELVMFPNGKWDDQVDSTSQALDSLNTWTGGSGFLEFIRQDIENRRVAEEGLCIVKPPMAACDYWDGDGVQHRPQADGCFHLARKWAIPMSNQVGWKMISMADEP